MCFSLKCPPNQTVHLIACLAFNFAQSLFNFLLSRTCHQCSDVLCLYKCHVPQLPAVAWPQKMSFREEQIVFPDLFKLGRIGKPGPHCKFSLSLAYKLWGFFVIILLLVMKWRERHPLIESCLGLCDPLQWVERRNQPSSDAFQMNDTHSQTDLKIWENPSE